ncbi:hypothetical protein PLESTB_001733400 [Pleodorina starrii]|uniref:Uncharacterized protein n=1 Tax=Pleodorina starrii TaxID=330485 RepID=A0A9W6F9E5_9CHLO|nr:hypothetical protein PLESTM_000735900 [Pleodorina starrii]GLC61229.1 hypothetical protein PLESTB_001733400 [Pleodorina starrii]
MTRAPPAKSGLLGRRPTLSVREAARIVVNNTLQNVEALGASARFVTAHGSAALPSNVRTPLAGRYLWQPEEIQVLVREALELPPGSVAPIDKLMHLLGWHRFPDPDKKLRAKLTSKFSVVRALLDHGADPAEVGFVRRAASINRANKWSVWVPRAFESLPDQQGTLEDVCAFLQADPDIAPLLDQRIYATLRTVPRWRSSVINRLKDLPGLTRTGEKRNGRMVYRYNADDAVVDVPAGGKRRTPKRGLPFLGKKNSNAN